jgi:hypothetical protein
MQDIVLNLNLFSSEQPFLNIQIKDTLFMVKFP